MVEVVTTDEFLAWYESLGQVQHDAVYGMVERLQEFGTTLTHPSSSALMGSKYALRELRVRSTEIRIAYAFDPKRNAVLILGGSKEGDDRFYEWLIPQAEKLWEQYLEEQGESP